MISTQKLGFSTRKPEFYVRADARIPVSLPRWEWRQTISVGVGFQAGMTVGKRIFRTHPTMEVASELEMD